MDVSAEIRQTQCCLIFAPSQNSNEPLNASEVFFRFEGVGIHGGITGLPTGWADLIGVGLDVLNGLERSQGFIDAAAKGEVVDSGVLNDAIFINEE